jgi:hypothetical protein
LNREMEDSKTVRWVTLLAALVLLYDAIDSMFFVRVADSDPLAWIERTRAILVGVLLITVSASLFVVAWTGRAITAISTTLGKLLSYAFCVGVGAFVFGLFLVRTIEHFDSRYVAGMVLCGAYFIAVLFWTRREVRRLAVSETAKERAGQFLWSCIFISIDSWAFGVALTAIILYSADFTRTFGAVFFAAIPCIGIYPVLRDAKRLADAVGPSQIVSNPSK